MNTRRAVLASMIVFTMIFATGLLVIGCSTLRGGDTSKGDPTEVSGTYQIRRFAFAPHAPVLGEINLLKYVQADATKLELTSSYDFVLSYRLRGERTVTLTGTYTVSSDKVTLKGQKEDAELYQQILLDRTVPLNRRKPNVLWFRRKKTALLKELSSEYEGLTGVEGLLQLELIRERTPALGGQ